MKYLEKDIGKERMWIWNNGVSFRTSLLKKAYLRPLRNQDRNIIVLKGAVSGYFSSPHFRRTSLLQLHFLSALITSQYVC